MIKKITALIMCLCLSISLLGCAGSPGSSEETGPAEPAVLDTEDLMENVVPTEHVPEGSREDVTEGIKGFAAGLFRAVWNEGNEESVVISPVSVLYAMAMTTNGAKGNTLDQLEFALGGKIEDLNAFLSSYMELLNSNKDVHFNMANGIWYNSHMGFEADQSFLQTNADFYSARLRKTEFNDDAVSQINRFVKENTFGMIENVLDSLDPETIMCLVNAIGFEGTWAKVYSEDDIREDWFTDIAGSDKKTEFLHSTERVYLSDQTCTGFMKYYSGDSFAFVALLPNEDVDISDFINGLTGEKLESILSDPQYGTVYARMPRFTIKRRFDLVEPLSTLGITDAFDPMMANFSGMGTAVDKIYVSDVLHDAFIQVDETGTKAAASTEVVTKVATATAPSDFYTVTLDHPFVYMIVDTSTFTPIFIGCVTEI